MANWASTSYAIEGPEEILQKIKDAILEHPVSEGTDPNWEGDILNALGIKWLSRDQDRDKGKYMRGFISLDAVEPWYDDSGALRFEAEEAWGATDFNDALEEGFPGIKVYYSVEEPGEAIYTTNDKEGKYFADRFYVDTCIDGNYESDYFLYKSSVYKWLHKLTNGRVRNEHDVEKFNSDYEDSGADDENYINIYEFTIVN